MTDVREYGSPTANGYWDRVFQLAADGVDPNRGGDITVPQGLYKFAANVTCKNSGTHFIGEGHPGTSDVEARGSTQIITDAGVTAFTCKAVPASHQTRGFMFSNMHVRATTGAPTGNGIFAFDVERMLFHNVTCSNFISGYGLRIDGGLGNAQYADLRNFSAGDCMIGLLATGLAPNGIRSWGGYYAGLGRTPRPGSKAIWIERGDTSAFFGTVIQGYETGVYTNSPAACHEFHSMRFEFCNIGFRAGPLSRAVSLFGGCFSNSLLVPNGGPNIAIQVDAGAQDTMLDPSFIDGVVTRIANAGTRTVIRRG